MITKNAHDTIELSLKSVANWVNEIVVIDDYSTDNTVKLAKKYRTRVFYNHEEDFGRQKAYGLGKTKGEWVLVLDSDEVIPSELQNEIKSKIKDQKPKLQTKNQNFINTHNINGYFIKYQTHYLGQPLEHGGEDYKKLVLFKKETVTIKPALIHEEFKIVKGRAGTLQNKIYHYSYRSIVQMFKKFTNYAFRTARQKIINGEKTSLKKIFLYPPHMFWARFIKDKGYKDGIFRLPLDLGFAYMEFFTYTLMVFNLKSKMSNVKSIC